MSLKSRYSEFEKEKRGEKEYVSITPLKL